jgi:hypothetical protein
VGRTPEFSRAADDGGGPRGDDAIVTATSEPQEARRTGDGSPPGEKGLKRDAISYVSNVVVATASTAPAYTLIGLACVIYDRRILLRSVGTFFSAGMLPRLGFLALVAVFVKPSTTTARRVSTTRHRCSACRSRS